MRPFWHPSAESLSYARKLADGCEIIYDVGGRKGREFMPGAVAIGWEGEEYTKHLDFEKPVGIGQADFAYCRHTLEDLNNPSFLLEELARCPKGYIECPSALAELSRGVEVPMRRGYTHHRWVVRPIDGVLTFIPKLPIVDTIKFGFDDQAEELLKDQANWNTAYTWDEENPLRYKVLQPEKDFSFMDINQYRGVLGDNSHEQYTVMIARFPYGWYPFPQIEHPDCADWLMTTYAEMKLDPRISRVRRFRKGDTPISMVRNECIEVARHEKVDFLVLLDSDMCPDVHLIGSPYPEQWSRDAKPFWQTSFDFAIAQRAKGEPCVIAAPYCGPSPHQNVYVFQWDNWRNNYTPDAPDMKLDQFTRAEASKLSGIQEVAALPTGLMLIDMQAVEKAIPPYFYYEYTNDKEHGKASTEDVTFTRDMALYGVKQFCNWDAWAGHHKHELVTKPVLLTTKNIGDRQREAIRREFNINRGEELVDVKPYKSPEANGNGHSSEKPWQPEWLRR